MSILLERFSQDEVFVRWLGEVVAMVWRPGFLLILLLLFHGESGAERKYESM